MSNYRLIGMILHPEGNYDNPDSIADYNVISKNEDNAVELLRDKYFVESDVTESFPLDDEYVIDEDGDGFYLFEKIQTITKHMENQIAYNYVMALFKANNFKVQETETQMKNDLGDYLATKTLEMALKHKKAAFIQYLKDIKCYPTLSQTADFIYDFMNVSLYEDNDELFAEFSTDLYWKVTKILCDDEDLFDEMYDIIQNLAFNDIYTYISEWLNGKNLHAFGKALYDYNNGILKDTAKESTMSHDMELLAYRMEANTNEDKVYAVLGVQENHFMPCVKLVKGTTPTIIQKLYGYSDRVIQEIESLEKGGTFSDNGIVFVRLN